MLASLDRASLFLNSFRFSTFITNPYVTVLGTFRTTHRLNRPTETGCLARALFFASKLTDQLAYPDRYLSRNPTLASAVGTENTGWHIARLPLFVPDPALADPWTEEC